MPQLPGLPRDGFFIPVGCCFISNDVTRILIKLALLVEEQKRPGRSLARARARPTSDEGGSAVPNSRLITAVIWISRTPVGDAGPLGSTQTTTTADRHCDATKTRPPPRNQTRAAWEIEWKARRGRWELWRATVSIISEEELRSSSGGLARCDGASRRPPRDYAGLCLIFFYENA